MNWIASIRNSSVLGWLAAALLLVVAVIAQSRSWIPADTSWQLTLGSQYLDGREIYKDVIEVNPPLSMLIYLPAVWLARILDLRPELLTSILVFLTGLLSAIMSVSLLDRAKLISERHVPYCYCAAFAIFFILPGSDFTQREQIALILLIPALAALMVRTCHKFVPVAYALVAGLFLGITISIKPHFLLGYAPMVAWSIWRKKSLAPAVTVENLCAAAVGVGYVALVFSCFPAFIDSMLPLLRDVYLPVRLDTSTLLLSPLALMTGLLMLLTLGLAQGQLLHSLAPPALFGSAGFGMAVVIQGKGWPYHFYPALSLSMIALLIVIAECKGTARARRIAAFGLIAGFALSAWQYSQRYDYKALFAALKAVAPSHPRMLAASADIKDGHPITRWLDGTWVGSSSALWISAGASYRLGEHDRALAPADRARLISFAKLEAARFANDVRTGRPDIVLVSKSGRDWIDSNPNVSEALRSYRDVDRVGDISILRAPGSVLPVTTTN